MEWNRPVAKQIVVPEFVRDSLAAGRLQLEDGEYYVAIPLLLNIERRRIAGWDDVAEEREGI